MTLAAMHHAKILSWLVLCAFACTSLPATTLQSMQWNSAVNFCFLIARTAVSFLTCDERRDPSGLHVEPACVHTCGVCPYMCLCVFVCASQEGLLSSSPAATRMSSRLSRKHSQASSHSGTSSSSSGSSGSSKRSLEGELEIAQVEMLLEAYQMHLDRQYNKLQTLEQTVQDTEALVGTTLDTHRNRIISVDIVLTAFYTALGLGNACTALFGVNLNLESLVHDGGNMDFKLVAIVGVVVVPIVLMALFLVWVSRNRVIQF